MNNARRRYAAAPSNQVVTLYMAHDFAKKKPVRRSGGASKPEAKSVPGWVWLSTGLLTGTFLSLLVYLASPGLTPATDAGRQDALEAANRAGRSGTSDSKSTVIEKRFDFYTLLPESEVLLPESQAPALNEKPSPIQLPSNYLLQAGSFRDHDDADRRRAELLLLGFDARIETVQVNGGETWHRVQVGPFASRSQLSSAKQRLIEQNIESLLIQRRP